MDTAGQEDYSALREQYVRSAGAAILVYSLKCRSSFERMQIFHDQVMRVKDSDFPVLLIGNKCDLEDEREVAKREGIEMAKRFGCVFMETSAKTGENIEECIFEIVRQARRERSKSNRKDNKQCVLF